jgi:predicted nucleotidyltransferase
MRHRSSTNHSPACHSFFGSPARFLLIASLLLVLLLSGSAPPAFGYGLASISITDTSLAEGDSGASNMIFTLTRSGDTSSAVVVSYATEDGSAIDGTDYTAQSGTVIIASGATSATVAVPILGNTISQSNRSFTLNLTGVTNYYGPPITLATKSDFTTGGGPVSVALSDVNGDGKRDLAVVNSNSDRVSLLLNTTAAGATTASFAAKSDFITGSRPYSVALGDINGDGKPDLAVANFLSNSVSLLLNTTATAATPPSFAAKSDFATGDGPGSVAMGDVNGDGKPDLAVANLSSNTVSLLLNTTATGAATASFTVKSDFATGDGPGSVAMGDVNGDGMPDLAVGNSSFASFSVSVLLNTTAAGAGAASFAAKSDFATGNRSGSVALGDVNGDGKPDMAVANRDSANVSLLLNTTAAGAATASFADRKDFATGSQPHAVVLGDVNGDGKPDMAVANFSSTSVSLLLNTTAAGAATASFAARKDFITGSAPLSVALRDVNGDGKLDLAVANRDSDSVSLLLNTTAAGATTASFAAKSDFATGDAPVSVALGDLDGDGKPDLAVANFNSNSISLLLNTTAAGAGATSFAAKSDFAAGSLAAGSLPHSVALGDVNGDGKPDLAVANASSFNASSASVSLLLNTTAAGASAASFAAMSDFATGTNPHSVALGDVNGDGKPDLAVANASSASVSLLLNTTAAGAGAASFAAKVDFATGSRPVSVALGDVNGDGKPDLAVANFSSDSVSLLLNLASTIAPTKATGTITDDDYVLSVSKVGTGSGTVSSTPAGIACGGDCDKGYFHGTVVTLTASADVGSKFTGWSGACTGAGACVVTMDAVKSVTAAFMLNSYALTTATADMGSGTVSLNPPGGVYNHGALVTATAAANVGSTFTGWSGACIGAGECIVTMDAAKSVTATFTAEMTEEPDRVYLPLITR